MEGRQLIEDGFTEDYHGEMNPITEILTEKLFRELAGLRFLEDLEQGNESSPTVYFRGDDQVYNFDILFRHLEIKETYILWNDKVCEFTGDLRNRLKDIESPIEVHYPFHDSFYIQDVIVKCYTNAFVDGDYFGLDFRILISFMGNRYYKTIMMKPARS